MSGKSLEDLTPFGRELTVASLEWSEQFWDSKAGLLALGPNFKTAHRYVRESIWFAVGLLLRRNKGDFEQAIQIIQTVCNNQFDEPGTIYHGTFRRYVGEPHPPEKPMIWHDFDPNWRQFIGTVLAIILEEYINDFPDDLISRMNHAIQIAVEGEPEDRCPPSYTNIALMKTALMTWAGHQYEQEDWVRKGETFGQSVYELFVRHNTFDEYNAPTYYGVNFYALGLWKLYAHSNALAQWGTEIEATVWQDVTKYYHPDLKNMCGPFTRSYGMNMPTYGALLGMSIWVGMGRNLAPFPKLKGYFDHCHDFCYGPCFGLVSTNIPKNIRSQLEIFSDERLIKKRISSIPDRVATAWLCNNIMIGAEATVLGEPYKNTFYNLSNQFHPVTMHWKLSNGKIGWMRLCHIGAVNARAGKGSLTITAKMERKLEKNYGDNHRNFVFQFCFSKGNGKINFSTDRWVLPGLHMDVKANVDKPEVVYHEDKINIIYTVTTLDLEPRFEFDIQVKQ